MMLNQRIVFIYCLHRGEQKKKKKANKIWKCNRFYKMCPLGLHSFFPTFSEKVILWEECKTTLNGRIVKKASVLYSLNATHVRNFSLVKILLDITL